MPISFSGDTGGKTWVWGLGREALVSRYLGEQRQGDCLSWHVDKAE